MTMPKKGSRLINVGGISYRFMVRDEGQQLPAKEGSRETLRATLVVTVEPEENPGHVFVASFRRDKLPELDPVGKPVVERLIRLALQQGWAPKLMHNFTLTETVIQEHASLPLVFASVPEWLKGHGSKPCWVVRLTSGVRVPSEASPSHSSIGRAAKF